MSLFVARTEYSRAELLSDAVVHLAALLAALVAVPVLITLAAVWHGNAGTLTAVSVYGATLVAMIFCSLLYNHLPRPDWRDWLRRLDHSAIYLKIAGTYTPFAVLTGAGTGLLAGSGAGALVAADGYSAEALGSGGGLASRIPDCFPVGSMQRKRLALRKKKLGRKNLDTETSTIGCQ